MSDDGKQPSLTDAPLKIPPTDNQSEQHASVDSTDRTSLLQTARAFLNSPQVRHEDAGVKRNFLSQKGLNAVEIEQLLQEAPPQAPLIPPRTYPQPLQSNLPDLLAGIFRIATWITGGSAALVLVYFRFIYPRIAQTYQARHALRTHHKDLLQRLTSSIEAAKAEQSTVFALLPRPEPHKEDAVYADFKSLDDVLASGKDPKAVPSVTLLRCAIRDLVMNEQKATTEAIFRLIEDKMPWMRPEEDAEAQTRLWDALSSMPVFAQSEEEGMVSWSYTQPSPPQTPPLLSSLSSLQTALPSSPAPERNRFQNTLQALSDFTGYIASQTYTLPTGSFRYTATGMVSNMSPEEEELRREIRALKGLVLNRRTFVPPRPKVRSTPPSWPHPSEASASDMP